jgi:hypothetical protein
LYVLDALRYPFPDQADTLPEKSRIRSDEDYIGVESFLVKQFRPIHEGMPRPGFMTIIPPMPTPRGY